MGVLGGSSMRLRHLCLFPLLAAPAMAEPPLRDLCTTRPSIGTSACIVDKGHALIEFGAADWELETDAEQRVDTLLTGVGLFRYGVTETTEVQLGWTAFGRVREHDRTAGTRERRTGTGDVTLTLRQNLRNPDGSGTSYGLQPSITLPTGGHAVGAGTWGAAMVVPVSFELKEGLQLVFDPEGDAQPDEDGHGRHLRYGNITGLQLALSKAISATLELSTFRDHEPEGHFSETLAAFSASWQTNDNFQLDAGVVAGLNHHSADVRLQTGASARF
jgi:hypothetical protein